MSAFNIKLYLYPPEAIPIFVYKSLSAATMEDVESVSLKAMGALLRLREIYGEPNNYIDLTILADDLSITSRLSLLGKTPSEAYKYDLEATRQLVLRAFNRDTANAHDLKIAYVALIDGENLLKDMLYKATRVYYGSFTEKTVLLDILGGDREIAVRELRYNIVNLGGGGSLVIEKDGVTMNLDLSQIPTSLRASVLMRARQQFRIYVIPSDPANPPELSVGVVYSAHEL